MIWAVAASSGSSAVENHISRDGLSVPTYRLLTIPLLHGILDILVTSCETKLNGVAMVRVDLNVWRTLGLNTKLKNRGTGRLEPTNIALVISKH